MYVKFIYVYIFTYICTLCIYLYVEREIYISIKMYIFKHINTPWFKGNGQLIRDALRSSGQLSYILLA